MNLGKPEKRRMIARIDDPLTVARPAEEPVTDEEWAPEPRPERTPQPTT